VQDVDARPDVAQARVNLEVAKRNLRNVWFQFLPTLSAQSTLASTGQPVYSSLATTWNIQAVLSVSIWDGGARYGLLRNARAAEDIAAQTLVALRRQALVQVQQARRQLVVAQASYGVAKEQRDLAAQNEQMTQTAYTAGQATSLELVTASEAHRQAELNLALQEFGVVKARLVAALALASCPW
jgi:outer membrane protein TolC